MRSARPIPLLLLSLLMACGRTPGASLADRDGADPSASDAGQEFDCGAGTTSASGGGLRVDDPRRARAVGSACAVGAQCLSGLCSAVRAAGACGVCLDRRALGAPCDGPLQGCAGSAACDNGTCVSRKKVAGAACTLYRQIADIAFECDDELYCDPGSPLRHSDTGVCAPRIPVGSPCDAFQACVRGAECREGMCAAVETGTQGCPYRGCPVESYCDGTACQSGTLPLGAHCQVLEGVAVPGECAPGTLCRIETTAVGGGVSSSGTCVPTPGEGDRCVFGQCAAGFYCAMHTIGCSTDPRDERCERLRGLGESCETSSYPPRDDVDQYSTCAPDFECRADRCERPCG